MKFDIKPSATAAHFQQICGKYIALLEMFMNVTRRDFLRSEFGSVALPLAVALPVCLMGAAAAIDYQQIDSAKRKLDAACDSAVLAALSHASYGNVGNDGNPSISNMQTYGETVFTNNAADLKNVASVTPSINVSLANSTYTAAGSYTATIKVLFPLIGEVSQTISGASKATAGQSLPKYANFYIVIDNSGSMGMASSAQDMLNLNNYTQQAGNTGCSLACHNNDSKDEASGVTNEQIAHQNNVSLRIDEARSAVHDFLIGIPNYASSHNYNASVFGLNSALTTLVAPTNNISSAANAIGTDWNNSVFDLADSSTRQNTDFDTALNTLKSSVSPSVNGDGSSSSSPANFIFLVTDGIQHTSGGKPTAFNFDCSSLRAKATVIVVYVDYIPPYRQGAIDQGFLNDVQPQIQTSINNLQSCASPGYYFSTSNGGNLSSVMKTALNAPSTQYTGPTLVQ